MFIGAVPFEDGAFDFGTQYTPLHHGNASQPCHSTENILDFENELADSQRDQRLVQDANREEPNDFSKQSVVDFEHEDDDPLAIAQQGQLPDGTTRLDMAPLDATEGKEYGQATKSEPSLVQLQGVEETDQAPANVASLPPRKTIRPVTPSPASKGYKFQAKFPTQTAAVAFLEQKVKINLGVKVDDVAQVKLGIDEYCRRAFEALTHAAEPAGEEWKPERKHEYEAGQSNAMTSVTNMMSTREGCENCEAVTSFAVHQTVELHEIGTKKYRSDKLKVELGYTCSGRINTLIEALRSNKLCCKDLLEGKVDSLIYAPKKALKIKRDNTASNSNKAAVLKDAAEKRKTEVATPLSDAVDGENDEPVQPPRKKRRAAAKARPSDDEPRQPAKSRNAPAANPNSGSKKASAGKGRGGKFKHVLKSNFESVETPQVSTTVQQAMPSLQSMSSFDSTFNWDMGVEVPAAESDNGTGAHRDVSREIFDPFGESSDRFGQQEPLLPQFGAGAMTATTLRDALPSVLDNGMTALECAQASLESFRRQGNQ